MSADPQTLQPADTSAPQEKPILSIYNVHVPDCGKPPAIEVRAETKGYYGYFVNLHGEQWILTYDFDTETGILRGGDAGWQNMCAFLDGQAPGVTLNEEERIWLRACWEAINETRKVRDDRRQASGTDLKGRPRTGLKTRATEGTWTVGSWPDG